MKRRPRSDAENPVEKTVVGERRRRTRLQVHPPDGAKGEVPKGKKVVRPTAGFVVKTKKLEEGSEIVGSDKVFINVVASTELAEPTSKQEAGGSRWSLPHLLGPPRMERDKKDATASTFDCRAPGPESFAAPSERRAVVGRGIAGGGASWEYIIPTGDRTRGAGLR